MLAAPGLRDKGKKEEGERARKKIKEKGKKRK
jgi:hypothetical protein